MLVVVAALAASCTTGAENSLIGPGDPRSEPPVDDTTTVIEVEPDLVPEVLASLTPEQKIGQLLMPQVFGRGDDVTADERVLNLRAHGFATPTEIVEAYQLGGVIYLEENIDSAEQVRGLSQDLQAASRRSSGVGLLVAIDQEGGRVSRLSDEVTLFPPASDLAGDPRLVKEASYITGQQVQHQGINVVLAPVADVVEPGEVSFIGNRSFGTDPDVVANMVAAAVDGLQQSGVAAAVKHWPGHGATGVNSHFQLPTVDVARADWEQRERVPFDAAIAEDVAIVLVGHLAVPGLDALARPATVSPILIEDLLRHELGFDGVVMTDALNMGAVDDIPPGELVVASILAGADVILIPPSLTDAAAALQAAVDDGTIDTARLDAAVTRVLRLKQSLGLLPAQ